MSRKDYVLLAAALKQVKPSGVGSLGMHRQWKRCCHAIADALQADNGRFDRSRFLEACGMGDVE